MTDDAFDRVFGSTPRRPSFTEKVARGEAFGGQIDPRHAMAVEAASVAPAPGEYRAFGFLPAGNVNLSCEVRWWMEGTIVPEGLAFPYRLLMEVGFSGEDTLRLRLPDKVIEITGRRLEPLRQALMRQQVTFLQQWTSLVWPAKPTDVAVIKRILVAR
ncbi:hypothetical protein ER13_04025 [Brevundimonas sp. EAKA]|uniref:hypothetical protein n=1 Tax=Brevundimonas sp. EAKA TaxID=1495854 RepID=UPI0004A97FE8|nr:hypothetical protein [Brevundimonas sp. EAKA]KDP95302.1 hypothetical protein ER13_04025 [Brevundimonas sp. EAKA]